jgi:signal transduction histidine kinase
MSPIALTTPAGPESTLFGERLRKVPADAQDAALALALALGAEAEVIIRGATDPATLILAAVGGLSLLARRRAPWVMTVTLLVALLGRTLIVGGEDSDVVAFAGLVVAYSLGAHMPGRGSIVAVGALLVGYVVDQVLISGFSAGLVPGAILLFGAPWWAGRALSSNRQLTVELHTRTTQLEHEREERARLAVLQERGRLAVQINDVVTRGIAAMVSHADTGRAALGSQRATVEEALREIEQDGRQALGEMRRLLGVLRTDDSRNLAPQPSLSELDRLAETARAAGLDVALSVEGQSRPLPTGVDVSAYRILQEALRNAREQQDQMINVTVSYGDSDLRLEVAGASKDGALPALNEHWVAIRERVALYGGALATDRAPSGGYVLTARLPLEAGGD